MYTYMHMWPLAAPLRPRLGRRPSPRSHRELHGGFAYTDTTTNDNDDDNNNSILIIMIY